MNQQFEHAWQAAEASQPQFKFQDPILKQQETSTSYALDVEEVVEQTEE